MKKRIVTAAPMILLPPQPHLCQECAASHKPSDPHDATSLYYQTKRGMAKQPATWAAAMEHCTPEVKAYWTEELTKLGIDINSTNTRGNHK